MVDITKVIRLRRFQLSTPDNPNPRLAAPISADSTTLTSTAAPLDRDGEVITDPFIATCQTNGYTEGMLVYDISEDGKTWTVKRGLFLEGLDKTTGNASLAITHEGDDPLACSTDSIHFDMALAFILGDISSGANSMKIGAQDGEDVYLYADNGATNPPYIRITPTEMFYAPDGVTENPFGGTGSITAGLGLQILAGVVGLKLGDTDAFVSESAGSADGNKIVKTKSGGYIDSDSVEYVKDLTVSVNELNQLDGIGATVNAGHLDELTNSSDADEHNLHHHTDSITPKSFLGDRSTTSIAHGFGSVPARIRTYFTAQSVVNCNGVGNYDGINTLCSYAGFASGGKNTTYFMIVNTASGITTLCTVTMDTTNINLTWEGSSPDLSFILDVWKY